MEQDKPPPIQALEQHLGTVRECFDEVAGSGYEATIGEQEAPMLSVTIFPETRIAKLHTPHASLTLRGASLTHNAEINALELVGQAETECTRTHIQQDGGVIFISVPQAVAAEALERVRLTEPPAQEEAKQPAGPEHPAESERGGPQEPLEKQERVRLTGRVGAEPHVRTTNNDVLVCHFPLAVPGEAGKTSWHRVVAFKDKARALQGTLKKGDNVDVIGYRHTREQQNQQTGQVKRIEEIWAAVVKQPKAQR